VSFFFALHRHRARVDLSVGWEQAADFFPGAFEAVIENRHFDRAAGAVALLEVGAQIQLLDHAIKVLKLPFSVRRAAWALPKRDTGRAACIGRLAWAEPK